MVVGGGKTLAEERKGWCGVVRCVCVYICNLFIGEKKAMPKK